MALWIRSGSRGLPRWRSLQWTWYWRGTRAKGWWTLGAAWRRWTTEVEVAIGGEDNMLQLGVGLPLIGYTAIGVQVPRRLTKGWVHHRREFGVELRGIWPEIHIAYDDQMNDMSSHYRRTYLDQGKPLPDYLNRVTLHPGWRIRFGPVWWARLKNKMLGSYEHEEIPIRTYDDVELALPEGVYVGKVTFSRSRMKRKHWRTRRDDIIGEWEGEQWLPFPGKGESSYDCGDDGFKEHSTTIRAYVHEESAEVDVEDVNKVVASTISAVLRQRGRYGGLNWKPEGIGVMR